MKNQDDKKSLHWSEEKEVAKSNRPIRFLVWLVKILPFGVLAFIALPVSFFYWIFSKRARIEAKRYQKRIIAFSEGHSLKRPRTYPQVLSFALTLVEKVAGWCGKASLEEVVFHDDDIAGLNDRLCRGEGVMLIGSHLGNMELLRTLATYNQTSVDKELPVVAIMDMNVTARFNQTLADLNPLYKMDLISASDIGVDTVEKLQDCIARGGLVVIAGDRTSANAQDRNFEKDFLGQKAAFPYGSFFLASILNASVYFVFALRQKTFMFRPKYDMIVKKSSIEFDCGRKERIARSEKLCGEYVSLLEKYAMERPFQWYNFFDFWSI